MKKLILTSIAPALALPRGVKRFVAISVDAISCLLAVWLSYYLRLGEFVNFGSSSEWSLGVIRATVISVVMALPIFAYSGFYRAIFRYSGWPALLVVTRAVGLYALLYATIFTVISVVGVPRTVGIIQPILLLLFVGTSRVLVRMWLGDRYLHILKDMHRSKVLVYGAGETGRQLVDAMRSSRETQVVGFIDDDHRLHGHSVDGTTIFNPVSLERLVSELKVNSVLLAMPSLSRDKRNAILAKIRPIRVSVRTLPSVSELAKGKVTVSDLRELDIDDLLGREPVVPNSTLLKKNVLDKVVMVTGAGGSIGSELCRRIVDIGPSKLLLIEQNEFALYRIHQELEENAEFPETMVIPLIASVQDDGRMNEIMSAWTPDTIYHAAAYKHVPLVEHNPSEGIKNNVFGTLCAARAAINNGVSNFVLISTDKAVRPTNIMGASKRLAELILQALAINSKRTRLSMVRFGNVLGSSGSVVPRFRKQVREGGPITVTHPDITRYFMTIKEAAQLVIQAGAMSKGGDVFVLDMGQPVKIVDLAQRIIEMSGFTLRDDQHTHGDIEIQFTGLRPGEKLYEELLIGDNPESTSHARIMRAKEDYIRWEELEIALNQLQSAVGANDVSLMRKIFKDLINGYVPGSDIVEWVYMKQRTKVQEKY